MINHISGKLVEKTPSWVVIECNGVGYVIQVSLHTYSKIGEKDTCKLFTHLQIREDAHTLYGFADIEERKLFKLLISVSGVGASTAQIILSSYKPQEVVGAISHDDVDFLKSIKGIGAKTAQRIIIDLKDKLAKEEVLGQGEISFSSRNTIRDEALSALIALGFDNNKSKKMLEKLVNPEEEQQVEDLIKLALKHL